ncbi:MULTISPECIES: PDZ domain-containing protein [Clostridium]|uniref:PDZ domain-containing protein n=1 Tax=Clostridium cibarium TaxID=2762247 RepID=A0ABR8PSF7_9CLOT|nr:MULTISPECIES: PDZ domain-containing protein [Clostridium]MBD7911111.1 PDZ domain-containing protein [Clostridium cibarium]
MDLIIYTLRSVAYVIVEPSLMIMLIILGIVFYSKNRKLVAMQRMVIGEEVNSSLELTLSQIVLGIFAGILASIILSYLGVIFDENSGIEFLFMISILLMFIKPRLVCFSYSGAILGGISLIFSYFNIKTSDGTALFNLDIVMLMTFVGVMHIVEALLVMFDGSRGAVPVFSNKKGKILGGYAFGRYWILPVAIFIAYRTISSGGVGTDSIGTPEWWPILRYDNIVNLVKSAILSLSPLFGVLGYSSLTFTRRKREKAVSSGIFILAYGIILVLVAQLGSLGMIGKIAVIIFAPLAHEGMLVIQRKIEEKRIPLFVSDESGIAILDVVPFSKAHEIGLKAGDRIVSVNDKVIDTEADIYSIIKESLNCLNLKIKDKAGEIKEFSLKQENNRRLGVVLVPKFVDVGKIVSFDNDKFSEVLKNIKDKNKK